MILSYSKSRTLALAVILAACAPTGPGPGPTSHTTGEHMATGTEIGPTDADGDGTMDGTGWDTDADGRADEIDTDGDGTIDGEDNNGDGIITLWDELGTGALEPTPEQIETQIVDTDPDFDQALDPTHPPDSVDPGTGEVTPPSSVILGDGIIAENQGTQGSCAAFANAALATIVRHEREGGDINALWASPAFLYAYQVPASGSMCSEGTYINTGLDILVAYGAATRDEVPYQSGDMPMLCEVDPAGAMEDDFRVGGYESVRPFDTARIREVIAAGSPVAFGTPLSEGFMTWAGEQAATEVFDFGADPCTGMHCGGHAMVIVGYDDDLGAFRVLNSWGEDWGDRGFFWLSYDYFDRGRSPSEVYGFAVTPLPEPPAPLPAPDAAMFYADLVGEPVLRVVDGVAVLTIRVALPEPLWLTTVTVTDSAGTPFPVTLSQWVTYGNIALELSGTPAPGPAVVSLDGTLRDESPAGADLDVDVPEPEADPDGAN